MKLRILAMSLASLLMYQASFAQDKTVTELRKASQPIKDMPKLDSGKIWTTGGIFNFNIGQSSQQNWAAGGDDFSFSLNAYFGLWARYKKDKISWDNLANFNYGLLNSTSLGTRKNDDRINLTSKLGYAIGDKVNVAFLANFQSQFSKGYAYNSNGSRDLLSNFLAPGYLTTSVGIDYHPLPELSIFVSPITNRLIFVNDDSLSTKGSYGVDPGKKIKSEIGAFASITYNKKFNDKITYSGRLDLFSNYQHNPQNVDLLMNNMAIFKVSKILSFNIGLDLIYDDDVKLFGPNHDSPGLQIREALGVGFTINL